MTSVATALREVSATRYLTPLREGGSLPGLVEADDLGMYVVKFRGAGQGPKVLVAEVVTGELARALGLPVPELVTVAVDAELGRSEPDEEVQDLLRASRGRNVGMDYLPGSLGFDPVADPVDPGLAARVLWLDALVLNVDRSWRNPNLLRWHGRLWLIDHGASLYVHHSWATRTSAAARAYAAAADHVLLRCAGPLATADAELAPRVTPDLLAAVLRLVPDEWLGEEPGIGGPDALRATYVELLTGRVEQRATWLEPLEATRARV